MAISAEDLDQKSKYVLLYELRFDDIIPFIFENIKRINWSTLLFLALNLFFLSLLVSESISGPVHQNWQWQKVMLLALFGLVVGPLILVPVHELIHGMVYLLIGAPKIKLGADLSQFIFYVTAHRFVVSKTEFHFIALTPFVIISTILLLGIVYSSGPFAWVAALVLFAHSTMCIGDFSMVSFYQSYPGRKIYTYDNTETMTSYFYTTVHNEH